MRSVFCLHIIFDCFVFETDRFFSDADPLSFFKILEVFPYAFLEDLFLSIKHEMSFFKRSNLILNNSLLLIG